MVARWRPLQAAACHVRRPATAGATAAIVATAAAIAATSIGTVVVYN